MSQSNILRQLTAAMVLAVLLLSACSTSKKSTTKRTDPTTTSTNKPSPEKKTPEEKKAAGKAPFNVPAFGQVEKKAVYNVAIFAPLYLDSVFNNTLEIPGRTMPRYVLPGLDFYEGAQLALDTLQQQGFQLNVLIYDSKAKQKTISNLIRSKNLDQVDLIIGAVNTPELKELSDFAREKQVNFVSATYPNDGGINNNPFLLIANSTLKTHTEAIQNYVQQAFATKNIVLLRRNTSFEGRIAADIKAAYEKLDNNKKTRIREVIWNEGTSDNDLAQYLLTDRPNICIVTAMDEAGAKSILRKLSVQAASYPLQIFGMPTWDIMKFKEPELKTLQVYYSSPYFNDKNSVYSKYIYDYFKRVYKARPSDMAFKGFEMTYYFVRQLVANGVYFNTAVNDASKQIFTSFNYLPVYLNGEEVPSYFENKNIYIIQKGDSADIKMN